MRVIESDARRHLATPPGRPGREALLAYDVSALLSLAEQRRRRAAAVAAKEMREPYPCACGRTRDGELCMVRNGKYRSRIYASAACRMHGYRLAKRLAARNDAMKAAAAQAGQAQPTPAADPRSPHWR